MSLRSWLGLSRPAAEPGTLRALVDALDRLEPERARFLARFAYLLGRVAHADRHIAPDETRTMEALVHEAGGIEPDLAMLVVSLARQSNVMFGGHADYEVAREFGDTASYEEKLALARCLFAVAATDASISMPEETEIHRILNVLKIDPGDLTRLRLEHRRFLPGLGPTP